ncbi:MAG: methyltransferase domain-containing protein [Actinobacteria bacterium]|nr:methyltransferase domain-containing protein [Actinomycetota bacterium]
MDEIAPETAEWLVDDGRDHVTDATDALDHGESELAVVARLRATGLSTEQSGAVVGAASARRRARATWPAADRLLFTRTALEQASDPQVSTWRTRRLADADVWDLGAGVGGDTLAAAAHGARVTAVDLDAARLTLLRHNAAALGADVTIVHGDALRVRPDAAALVHADPGRRLGERRVRRLVDHQPPVGALVRAHAGVRGMAIVLSPAVDLGDPDLPPDAELEFVQTGGDLREAVAWTGELRGIDVAARATLLPEGHSLTRTTAEGRAHLQVGPVGEILLDVAPAAVRARLHDRIGAEHGARRIARTRALLCLDAPPAPDPWVRWRRVHAVLPVRAKAVRAWLRTRDVDAVEFVSHGMPLDAVAWWRALGRPPRGPTGWRIELVRMDDGGRVLLTREASMADG